MGKNLPRRQVATWLASQGAYSLYKGGRKHFKKNKTIVAEVDTQWQADLVDMQQFSKHNSYVKYILTVTDISSNRAWAMAKGKPGAC